MVDVPPSTGDERRARLEDARLYLVVESRLGGEPAWPLVEAALDGGVDIVQLRDKRASDAELTAAGERLARACAARGALFVVNDRPDLARACGADAGARARRARARALRGRERPATVLRDRRDRREPRCRGRRGGCAKDRGR